MKQLKVKLLILLVMAAFFVSAHADEGMWLFNMAPVNVLKAKYNFTVTPDWLQHIQLASVRFGGASGSFVSPDGLVLTNHHVGQGAIQNLSTKDRDLMKTGFYARTRAEELKAPGMELSVLQGIEDVTAKVTGAVTPDMTPAQAALARDKAIAAIEKESADKTGLRSTVVNLYSGGMFHLYRYKIYNDVRLVFAPEYAVAFYGGDPDNFTYPRFDFDITIFRLYENDKPVDSKHYLKWNTAGLKEGDLIFASGHPGSTGRLLTMAQMEFLRDVSYPFTIASYQRRQALLKEYGKRGPEYARQAQGTLFGIENSLKATIGYQSGLLDKALMAKKAQEEQAFRAAIAKDPALEQEFGKAWDELARAEQKYASVFKPLRFFEGPNGFTTSYFSTARSLVRLAQEKTKPNDDRLPEYRDAALPSLTRRLLTAFPVYDELEVSNFTDSLIQLQKEFGQMLEVKWLFQGRLAEDVAKDLIAGSKLKDIEVRKRYMDGGLDAIYSSDDPMIKLALMVDPISRGLRKRYETEVDAVETKNAALIARAILKVKGTSVPPDATSTLRLSFGTVKSYMENGKKIPITTSFKGMYDLSAKAGNKPPYELPASFLAGKAKMNLDTPIDFIATCDSIGGNSGSPVVNRKGEFSGVLFDGNIQSLPARFVYTDTQNRSVMVHSQGIIEALTKIYGAQPLVNELLGKK